ncbi:hypothetical protein H310_09921 [Aphanomyces invadans]|uniref:Uncharacterized protein n=1 Tax=Aphanomyces invadans TaxID=157072 RepID=A0A024TUT9_9STRA|nr:hypothetical protein H310_09921 [Aphanomyces invadans]ETV97112.1 hypothetical protein H310_09921 [Aphanomyces invadans]|eukprot:XP_008874358.1 hypothetical protein H310_09921 [Aphanomyces invadans]
MEHEDELQSPPEATHTGTSTSPMESTRPAQNHPPQQSPLIRATSITSLVKPSVGVAKSNKESRAQEALAMKDEQMRILSDQNTQLLATLNHLDDELQALKMEKVQCDDENRSLRDANFELQSRSRASEAVVKKAESNMEERDMQIKVLTDHNSELLRLLEIEEGQSAVLGKENAQMKAEAETLASKYTSLMTTAKMHEEMAGRAMRDGQLRAEEVRLLRIDADQLRTSNNELKMKAQVELESLHEQLRVRKEKQYQLLEKIQSLEEAKRQNDDTLHGMEEKIRQLVEQSQERDMQLQLESKAKRSQIDANKHLQADNDQLAADKTTLQNRLDKAEQERTRMEAENRDSADQLREMAEKVFQLLERLKLAELGKTKSLDALKQKEVEMLSLKKKNARLLKDVTQEGKSRVKIEMDKDVLLEQLHALKKHNSQLSIRCRDEVKGKLKEAEERAQLAEKLKTMSSRVTFLLNKMQVDEEAKLCTKEEMKKMHAQILSMQDKNAELTQKLATTGESNRVVTEALRTKQDDLDALTIKFDALQQKMVAQAMHDPVAVDVELNNNRGNNDGYADDKEAEASGRFFVECRASHGGLLVIKPKRSTHGCPEYLDKLGINAYLKWAQKQQNTKHRLVEKIALLCHQLMVTEEATLAVQQVLESKQDHLDHVGKKCQWLQEKLAVEEDAKRKTLIRYVHEVKSQVPADSDAKLSLKLPESSIGDEEVHAIAALLRNNSSIHDLQLHGNAITSEGARAIAAILGSATTGLKHIDLRKNFVGDDGIRVLTEALERNPRIRHVYVHAGGKIEALGANRTSSNQDGIVQVETVCVIDVRENQIKGADGANDMPDELMVRPTGDGGAASVGPLTSGNELFSKRPSALALANASVQEKKREWQRVQKQKKQMQIDREKLKQKELQWQGRAGGLELSAKAKKTALPPLDDAALERSASVPHMKLSEEQRPTSSGAEVNTSTGLGSANVKEAQAALAATLDDGGGSPEKRKKHPSSSAFSRRLKDSPLASSKT